MGDRGEAAVLRKVLANEVILPTAVEIVPLRPHHLRMWRFRQGEGSDRRLERTQPVTSGRDVPRQIQSGL